MLEGKDPALRHPGCVHQPVTLPWRPFSHFIYWHHPTHRAYTTNLLSGAEGKDCTIRLGSGDPSTPQATLGGASNGVLGMGLLEEKWTQNRLRKESGADGEGDLEARASHRPKAERLVRSLVVIQLLQKCPPPPFQLTLAQLAFRRVPARLLLLDSKAWGAVRELCSPELPVLVLFWLFFITLLASFLLRVCLTLRTVRLVSSLLSFLFWFLGFPKTMI